jgi:hypothetical protein
VLESSTKRQEGFLRIYVIMSNNSYASSRSLHHPGSQSPIPGPPVVGGDFSPRTNSSGTPREGSSAPNTHRSGSGNTPRDDRFYTPRSIGGGTPRTARSNSTDNENNFLSPRSSMGYGGGDAKAGGGPGSDYGTPRSGYQGAGGQIPQQQINGPTYTSAPMQQPSPRLSSLSSTMSPRQQQYQDLQYQQQYQEQQQLHHQEQEQLVQQQLHYQRQQRSAPSDPHQYYPQAEHGSPYSSPRTNEAPPFNHSPNAPRIQMPSFQSSFQQQLQQQSAPQVHSSNGSYGNDYNDPVSGNRHRADAKYSSVPYGGSYNATTGNAYHSDDKDYAYQRPHVAHQQHQQEFYTADAKQNATHNSGAVVGGGQYLADSKSHGGGYPPQQSHSVPSQVPHNMQEGQWGSSSNYRAPEYKQDISEQQSYTHQQQYQPHYQQHEYTGEYYGSDTNSMAGSVHTAQSGHQTSHGGYQQRHSQQYHQHQQQQQQQYNLNSEKTYYFICKYKLKEKAVTKYGLYIIYGQSQNKPMT